MAITVAEKTHWRDRIARKIECRTEELVAREDPTLLQRVSEQAREKAVESLGIASEHAELDDLRKRRAELERQERRLKAEQRARIRGTSVEAEIDRGNFHYGDHDREVTEAIKARAKALEGDILAESDLGRRVLSLREEKENLLDTVWLATSPSQIKELWEQVNGLLEAKPTALERKALEMAPVDDQ